MERHGQGLPSSTGWWRGRREAQHRNLGRKGRDSRAREECVQGVLAGGSDGADGAQHRLPGPWGPAQELASLAVD